MPSAREIFRQPLMAGVIALATTAGLVMFAPSGSAMAGESHPRAAQSEGRIAHERVSPDLWPDDELTRMAPERLARERETGPFRIEIHVEQANAPLVERIRRHADVYTVSESYRRISG